MFSFTAQSINISDLKSSVELKEAAKAFATAMNTSLNATDKQGVKQADLMRDCLEASNGNAESFAQYAQAFASTQLRTNWNSRNGQFKKLALKAGFTIKLVSDKDKNNKKTSLFSVSINRIDVEGAKAKKETDKKASDKKATKDAKQHDLDVIADHVASHGDLIAMPTTQAAILELMTTLLKESSITTQQSLFAMVGTSLEALATDKKVDQPKLQKVAH